MTQTIREVMTPDPVVLPASSSLEEAARCMSDLDIGDVLVSDEGALCGIVTDRDLVVRGLAAEPRPAHLGDICSRDLVTLAPDDTVDEVVGEMRQHAIRRVPVVENDSAVGMVSIGDLAVQSDRDSALAAISAARPNN